MYNPLFMVTRPSTVAELRAKYRSLVWSNPDGASDEAYILAALRRGSFFEMLDFACVFGLERLRSEWAALEVAEPAAARLASVAVERIMRNLQTAIDICAQTRYPEALGPLAR